MNASAELVLVVDDDALERALARRALESGGFAVAEAEDGAQALSMFQRCRPEIVLLDVNMPKLDGFQTCIQLRQSAAGSQTPILMITGLDDVESIHQAYQVGATDFVTKPVNWVILRQRVRYMLRAAKALQLRLKSEERNRALLDAIPDLIFRLSQDGTFLDYKPAVDIELISPPSAFLGRKISEALPEEIATMCIEHLQAALQTRKPQAFEYSFTIDGKTTEYEARMVVSGSDEVIALVRNMTERNQLEEELWQSQKMEALGLLAGGVAHDFNNALTVINFSAGVLSRESKDNPFVKKRVESILEATGHAKQLTDQLLAFTRRQVSRPRVLELNSIISGTRGLLERLLGRDIQVVTDLQPDLWPVTLDPGQVQQVLMNLAANALDAMAGKGTFTIETRNSSSVGSEGEEPRSHVTLTVGDTGCGMDKATVARIFEPFFTTKGERGTGLGLSTVFGIIRQSHGEVSVDSQPGVGSTFTFTFPAAGSQGSPIREEKREPFGAGYSGDETILVAENEPALRSLVCDTLEERGYFVLSALDGERALAVAKSYSGAIHLLLTDVAMPGLGGSRLGRAIAGEKAGLKIIYMSGYPDEVTLRHGVSRSDCDFLPKPFGPEELARKVREVLDRV